MCLIVLKKPDKTLTRKKLKTCFQNNSDGAGFMWAAKNKLNVLKGFMGFRTFYRNLRQQERLFPESTFILHFRINACGGVSAENTHPFFVNPNLAVVHNGVISELGSATVNDTRVFADQILAKLPDGFLDNPEIKNSIESVATKSFSKFVFLDNTGKYTIFNEKAGVWDNEMWFSNTSYKEWAYRFTNMDDYADEWTHRYSYNDSLNKTYRKCEVCGVYQPLSKLTWKHRNIPNGSGWVCDYCISKENYAIMGKALCICKTCKETYYEDEGIELENKVFYCNDCWSAIKATHTVTCPYCMTPTTVGYDESCQFCGADLDEEDYALQLSNLDFFEK